MKKQVLSFDEFLFESLKDDLEIKFQVYSTGLKKNIDCKFKKQKDGEAIVLSIDPKGEGKGNAILTFPVVSNSIKLPDVNKKKAADIINILRPLMNNNVGLTGVRPLTPIMALKKYAEDSSLTLSENVIKEINETYFNEIFNNPQERIKEKLVIDSKSDFLKPGSYDVYLSYNSKDFTPNQLSIGNIIIHNEKSALGDEILTVNVSASDPSTTPLSRKEYDKLDGANAKAEAKKEIKKYAKNSDIIKYLNTKQSSLSEPTIKKD